MIVSNLSPVWDRIQRPEHCDFSAGSHAVLTSPAETGAATLCLPQDVQAEAFDFPEEFFRNGCGPSSEPV